MRILSKEKAGEFKQRRRTETASLMFISFQDTLIADRLGEPVERKFLAETLLAGQSIDPIPYCGKLNASSFTFEEVDLPSVFTAQAPMHKKIRQAKTLWHKLAKLHVLGEAAAKSRGPPVFGSGPVLLAQAAAVAHITV